MASLLRGGGDRLDVPARGGGDGGRDRALDERRVREQHGGGLAVAAGRFAAAISVSAGGHTADAKSVLGVMGLGATSGQHLTVIASGPDAREAVAALIAILGEATRVGG